MIERLRIAQIAPIAAPVDPYTCRSVEHLVHLLTEELVRRGHDVTLFATGDSSTRARLHATYRHGYDEDDSLWNWSFHETLHVAAAFERASQFDVIHSHDYEFALPFVRLVSTPVVQTYHVLPGEDVLRATGRFPEMAVVAASRFQRSHLGSVRPAGVIHHGIDTHAFPFGPGPGEYLLFLGNLIPDKGPVEAIRLARAVDMPLILAGSPGDEYFEAEVAPLIDGRRVRYVGPVEKEERNELLRGAAALLYPLVVPEPFGLVMIEAMACGTPVLATEVGTVPEIVDEGVTGYYGRTPASLRRMLEATLKLDRTRIRRVAVERFDYRRMVDEYESLYGRLVRERRRRAS